VGAGGFGLSTATYTDRVVAVAGGAVTGPGGSLSQGEAAADPAAADPAAEVEAALAGLDETDPAAHADAFEAVNAAILAELQRLEAL
jgi:hypothetical protein